MAEGLSRKILLKVFWPGDGFGEGFWFEGVEGALVDAGEFPGLTGLFRDAGAPVGNGGVFGIGAFPHSAFGFDDPVYLGLADFLNHGPVGMVKANGTGELQIIHAELRAGIALLRGAEAGETIHVRSLVQELREAALEFVVAGDEIEHRALTLQRRGQVATPTKWQGLRQTKIFFSNSNFRVSMISLAISCDR